MKLVSSTILRNELGRYLEPFVEHLLGFCDELVLVDDGSTDGTRELLLSHPDRERMRLLCNDESAFYRHEGQARQTLLDFTLEQEPTHVLAIDADEFVADGTAVRAACATRWEIFGLDMEEIWQADQEELRVREDGGWRAHPVSILYAVPPARWRTNRRGAEWKMPNRKLASGRTPSAVNRYGRARPTGTEILHFGWTDEANRAARYARYTEHDGGRFHASAHLLSIMWPDDQVTLRSRPWPAALEPYRDRLVR